MVLCACGVSARRHHPFPVWANPGRGLTFPQAHQEPGGRVGPLALFESHAPQRQPLPNVLHHPSHFGHPEELYPAEEFLVHPLDHLRQTLTRISTGQFPQGLFESFLTLGSHPKLAATQQPVSQELAFPDLSDRALLAVCFQLEPVLQELGHARHHPLPGRFRLHINVAVVRIPAEPVTALFQFLVQVVQQYVRQ